MSETVGQHGHPDFLGNGEQTGPESGTDTGTGGIL